MRPSKILAALAVTLLLPALAGATAEPEPTVYCGSDYWFELREPDGWKGEWRTGPIDTGVSFRPDDGREVVIDVVLPLGNNGNGAVDVERALHGWISVMNVFNSGREMQPFELAHPKLRSAGARLVDPDWNVYAVALDPMSGRGNAFLTSLTVTGAPASPAELAVFGDTVRSLRYDASRVCEPGPNGETVTRHVTPPKATLPALPASAAPPGPPEPDFDLQRAALGCTLLSEMFVPIECELSDVDGSEAVVVHFDGDETPSTYAERYAERVAVPYCHEARRSPGAPALLFGQDDASELREYRCDPQGWAPAFQPIRVDRR